MACPGDTSALGGGFYLSGPRGRINNIYLIPTVSTVLTYATEVVATTNSWPIRTYAICADA